MKKTNKFVNMVIALVGMSMLTGCLEETLPASGIATEDQVGESSSAVEGLVMAMPAYSHQLVFGDDYHFGFGYASMMHIRDLQTGDAVMKFSPSGYDTWFNNWTRNKLMGADYVFAQYQWIYHWKFVQTINNVISAIDPASATGAQLGQLGTAYAYRAMLYLDMARMYEFLPNDATSNINEDGNDVTGLTVPIVKAGMSEADSRNNPRATHAEMVTFIEEDLNLAEQYLTNLTDTKGKTLPSLACAYGLKARLYMWDGNYGQAKIYARKAIDAAGVQPMTPEQCMNTTTGFNVTDPWMWGASQTSTNGTVTTGIINWTSWVCNETTFGYAGADGGPASFMIDRNLYERIGDTDFRKLMFKAPQGSPLEDKVVFLKPRYKESLPVYGSVKFRPGNGNDGNSQEGATTSYPFMRVEEMYFIEAEAAAHDNPAEGKTLVESFMKNYRDPQYVCAATSVDDVVEEIVFQKRVELWGEGQSFFDIKRLNYSVTRGYPGTNVDDDLARLNTNGRPAWMNWVIVDLEQESNEALMGWNNPDPSDKYAPWINN